MSRKERRNDVQKNQQIAAGQPVWWYHHTRHGCGVAQLEAIIIVPPTSGKVGIAYRGISENWKPKWVSLTFLEARSRRSAA